MEVARVRDFFLEQKEALAVEVAEERTLLASSRATVLKLDSVLEDSGLFAKTLEDSRNRFAADLHSVSKRLKESRLEVVAKDCALHKLLEQFERLLLSLRDPQRRPKQPVLNDLEHLRTALQKAQPRGPRDLALPDDDDKDNDKDSIQKKVQHSKPQLPLNRHAAQTATNGREKEQATQHRRAVDALRHQNLDLMTELNDLRFDRGSLRRKLADATRKIEHGPTSPAQAAPKKEKGKLPSIVALSSSTPNLLIPS